MDIRLTLAAVLAITVSIATPAFAAEQEIQGGGQNLAACGGSGSAELRRSGDDHRIPPECLPGRTGNVVAERALAQTGLAIGLASTVLQSQLQILIAALGQVGSCTTLTGGGSVLSNAAGTVVTVYYDTGCNQPYIVANPLTIAASSDGSSFAVAETATYHGLNGTDIGAMTIDETAHADDSGQLNVYGLGIFIPVSGARIPVQLGLYCGFATATTALCAGGIAQDFPALGVAIGAVTPLTLTVASGTATGPVTFTGGGSTVSGPTGSLTLTNPSPNSLVIRGGTVYTSTASNGGAAAFALFPPTPTAWSLNDTAHDRQFQISVVDNTARNLTFTITTLRGGKPLAKGALDQSGSGTITYSDGTTAVITNWTLAD